MNFILVYSELAFFKIKYINNFKKLIKKVLINFLLFCFIFSYFVLFSRKLKLVNSSNLFNKSIFSMNLLSIPLPQIKASSSLNAFYLNYIPMHFKKGLLSLHIIKNQFKTVKLNNSLSLFNSSLSHSSNLDLKYLFFQNIMLNISKIVLDTTQVHVKKTIELLFQVAKADLQILSKGYDLKLVELVKDIIFLKTRILKNLRRTKNRLINPTLTVVTTQETNTFTLYDLTSFLILIAVNFVIVNKLKVSGLITSHTINLFPF